MPLDKSGRVHVVGSVPLLHPEAQTVDEMLEGWRNQQMCRNLGHDTIAGRVWQANDHGTRTSPLPPQPKSRYLCPTGGRRPRAPHPIYYF